MYCLLRPPLHNLSTDDYRSKDITPESGESLLRNYCPSCFYKKQCKIKGKLEESVSSGKTFQNPSLAVLFEFPEAITEDFYADDELIKREDGLIETLEGDIFPPYNPNQIPKFSVCFLYQNQQMSFPEIKTEHPCFVHPLLKII